MFGNNKPFGTATTFGASAFGANTTPFGQTNTFGAKPATANVFGGSTFGAAAPQTGGLFGAPAPTTGAGLFGQQSTAFGQPTSTSGGSFVFGSTQPAGSLFGATAPATQQSAGLFGGSSTSAFGSPRTAFGGFGTTTTGAGLFGQSTSAGSGLFSSTSGFTTAATNGTTVKFNPPTGTDTMMKGGVSQSINTRHQCITCMKEYENKSLEELRMEDYAAQRKGPQATSMIGAFGGTTAQPSLFGAPTASTSAFAFGTTQAKPLFGTTAVTNTFGATGTGLFGQTAQPQNTGLFGKPGAFGAPTTTTSSFQFGTTPGTSLFGQNNQAKSLFGQPTAGTGLFGQPTTTQPANAFGMGTSFGGFGATSQPSTGLFGAKPTGFGTTNTTTTNTLSFGNSTAAGGLFGAKPAAPAFGTTSAFGSTGFTGFGTTTGTNTSLFGQTKPAAVGFGTTGAGFGSTLGTGFGTTPFSTTGLMTTTGLNTNPGLFGSTLTNKAPGFGAFGTGTTGFGGFGQPAAQGTSFNFGGVPGMGAVSDPNAAALLQQQIQAKHIFSFTASPFGDNPLFRNLLRDSKSREDILKPTNPAAQKAVLANNQFKVSPLPAAKIKPKPITPVPNGKVSLFDGLEDEEPSLGNETFIPKRSFKKLVLKPTTSQSNSNLSFTVTSNISSASHRNGDFSVSTSVQLEKFPSAQFNDQMCHSPPSSPLTVEISDRNPDERVSSSQKQPDSPQLTSHTHESPFIRKPITGMAPNNSPMSSPDDTIEALHTRNTKYRGISLGMMNSENSSHLSDRDVPRVASPDSTIVQGDGEPKPHPTGIQLWKSGYYTIPSLDELLFSMDSNGNCFVENFTIGRQSYGMVCFPDRINVANLNLDEIVHFRRKEITIYPDDSKKPPVGEELNRKAEITLDCVWPTDKTTHSPIKDPDRLSVMGYREKIEKSTSRLGAKFLDYRPETGSWVFEVEHFSKYGLEDSDDEGDDPKSIFAIKSKTLEPPKKVQITENGKDPVFSPMVEQNQIQKKLRISGVDEDDEMRDADGMSDPEFFFSPLHQFVTPGVDAERLQGMKRSFFLDEVEDNWGNDMQESVPHFATKTSESFLKPIPLKRSVLENFNEYGKNHYDIFQEPTSTRMQGSPVVASDFGKQAIKTQNVPPFNFKISSSQQSLSSSTAFQSHDLMPAHKAVAGKVRKLILKPYDQSLLYNKEKLIADMGYSMGRTFRVGWGPNMTLVHPYQLPEGDQDNLTIRSHSFLSDLKQSRKSNVGTSQSISAAIYKIQPLSDTSMDDVIRINLEKSLKIQLKHSVSAVEGGCPIFVPKPGTELLHTHAMLVERQLIDIGSSHADRLFVKQCYHVWQLCVALWGEIPGLDSEQDASPYSHQMARREAFSKWLIETSKEKVQSEINNNSFQPNGYLSTIFSHLSVRQISKAVNLAQENNDHCMSKLLAQMEGTTFVRRLVGKQLINWKESEAYKMVNHQRLKIYALMAGILYWVCHSTTINSCENLDWRRALALHLWYYCFPMASLQDAVAEFEKSFMDPDPTCCYSKPPYPPYVDYAMENGIDVGSKSELQDTCFHLLKLYCDRSHRLDKLLMPQMSTPANLDFRLSWFLHQALNAIGYTHLPADAAAILHLNFAAQLEAMGLWHWAIFIMLHLPNAERRTYCVKELLLRHLSLDPIGQIDEIEVFIQEHLLVPQEWIFEAKAIRAHSFGHIADEAWYLLKAGSYGKSHQIIIEHLASDAIINENYNYLLNFLKELAPAQRSSTIIDWASGGQVFLDYIHVSQMVESVIKGEVSAYDVEKLQPEVFSLCNRLSSIHCPTAKDRLCQSEMAKKTATLLRAVLAFKEAKSGCAPSVYTLAPYIKNLPMPEDYAIQELRALARNYLLAITSE